MVVCSAAVHRTLEPYCDSCKERVIANLLIGQMRLRGGEGEKLRKPRRGRKTEEERGRHYVLCLILYVAAGLMYAGVHICSVCVCRADGKEIWDTLPPPRHKMRHLSVSLI